MNALSSGRRLDAIEVVGDDLLGRDLAGAHALGDLVTAPLVHRGGSTRSPLPADPDQHAAGDDEQGCGEQPRPDRLALPEQRGREDDAPQRLRRVERRDDRDAPPVECDDQAEVGDAEADAGGRECA